MSPLTQILHHKLVAIIRGAKPEDVLPICDAVYAGGIKAIEITLNSDGALNLIKEIAQSRTGLLIGAGTVIDAASATQAMDAGAQFIISPSLDVEVIRLTKERGCVSIPGAFTPTEIVTAHRAGADIIKVFPAQTPQYLKDIKAPLYHIPMMPTGGVNLENIAAFKKAGAAAFGIGSSLVDANEEVTSDYLKALTQRAALFVQAIN